MKILLTADEHENQINGVMNSVTTLKHELKNLGHDVRILGLSSSNKSYKKDNNYYIGSRHIPIYPDIRYSFKKNDKYIDEIIKWKPDIVHVNTEFSTWKFAKIIINKLNIPYVMTCHTIYEDYIKYFCFSKTIGKKIVKRISTKLHNKTDVLIVPSTKLLEIEKRYGVTCPIKIIPTGIDLNRYQKKITKEEKNKILKKLGVSNNNKILVTVCRLGAEKNIDELLEFMPDLLKEDFKIQFIIVGDGPHKNKLIKKVKKLGLDKNVFFTGMINPNEVYKYYQLGDIFISASTSESQGLTYIEALANGLVMVCREDECLKDVINPGINGYTYDNKNEYIHYIIDILNDKKLKESMKKESFKKSSNFSKETFGKEVEKLYEEVISKK